MLRTITTYKSVLGHVAQTSFFRTTPWTSQSGFRMARFFDLSKIRLEMAGIGNEGNAKQLQCAILAVQPCPYTPGLRAARPLAELSPIKNVRQRSNTTKNQGDQTRSKKGASPHSNPIAAPPICSPEAGNSHGCRSMVFISCRFEHDREDCPLSAHMRPTCGSFSDVFFPKNETPFFAMELSTEGKTGPPPKTVRNHVLPIWRFWSDLVKTFISLSFDIEVLY